MKYILPLLFLFSLKHNAQILNAYAKVSAINVTATTFTVINVNEASHTFVIGGKIIVMQMQDDVIGTNTTNVSTFGDLGSIANVGNYEIRTISARMPATGTPTSITVSLALTNTFNTGVNSSVQLITFRDMGINFTTSANITGLPWDGNVGGVIGFEVGNMLTLNHSVSANTVGFLGGAVSSNFYDGSNGCTTGPFTSSVSTTNAFKGEGIYKPTLIDFTNGRGKILNGGGGGGMINSGGGGGGNYSSGGIAGFGWSCNNAPSSSGLGGISLSSTISGNRIFMGGGGGGGQQNNSAATRGGNGGGIILIKAAILATSTVCGSQIRISANGETAGNAGGDGAGGGGAAGSIILQINTFSVSSTCTLAVNANAGNGGSVNSSPHSGGGGGGQGVVIYSAAQPTVNVVTTAINGLPGMDGSGGTISGTSGGGVNNGGILSPQNTILPIELLNFDAQKNNEIIDLSWRTATEINNDYFNVERSSDAVGFNFLGTVKASNSPNSITNYTFKDTKPENGYNYYRLKQVDFDGTYSYSKIISFENFVDFEFSVFPNPLLSNQTLIITLNKLYNSNLQLHVLDVNGRQVLNRVIKTQNNSKIEIDNINLTPGVYIIRLNNEYSISTKKLIIE